MKNNLYKLGDFGLANAFTMNGEVPSAADIEEGDSRYMSKDLLDSSHKDLTKVSERASITFRIYPILNQSIFTVITFTS